MAPDNRLLRWCAQLLPAALRERVFDPAWADLQLDEAQRRTHGIRAHFARMILVVECVRLGVLGAVWQRGRPTRLVTTLAVVLAVASVIILRLQYPAPARR